MTEPAHTLSPGPVLVSAAGTHVGLVRKHNEDAYLDRADLGLWAVADGMGGRQAGDVASRTIIEALNSVRQPQSARDLMAEVRGALERANEDLLAHAEQMGDRALVASTVVCLLIFGEHYAGVWAGDSRLYLLRNGQIIQISHDHSVVQEMIDAGLIDSEEARRHPSGNQVTRAIGVTSLIEPEVVQDDLHPGDTFLLCSDGITRLIEDEEIGRVLADSEPTDAVREFIELALNRGAPDNATVVIVQYADIYPESAAEIVTAENDTTENSAPHNHQIAEGH